MANRYSVIQYFPDPVTDERINIGVVAVEQKRAEARFLSNWSRVNSFAGEKISFLQDFSKNFQQMISEQAELAEILGEPTALTEDELEEFAGWTNSIQFTTPRASLLGLQELLDSLCGRYLREPERRTRARGRRTAASQAARGVIAGLSSTLGEAAKEMVHRNAKVMGEVEEHEFDVVAENGTPYLAAHGISFEVKASKDLDRYIDATAWRVDDVRQRDSDFPIGVVVLPPKKEAASEEPFKRAEHLFGELDATMLTEHQVERWATAVGKMVAA